MQCSIGIEADNDPRNPPGVEEIIEAIVPDRIIRSVHFVSVEHPKTGELWAWPFDNPAFAGTFEVIGVEKLWGLYIDALENDLRTLRSDVVGHFYVPSKFGHWPKRDRLEEYEDRLLDICCEKSIAIELNTRVLYREKSLARRADYITANRRLLRKASRRNVAIVVGSDAHKTADQGRGFDIALELINSLADSGLEWENGAGFSGSRKALM
jgi:histidinol-phosphatase (PHP family)